MKIHTDIPHGRRGDILKAAAACFARTGIDAATIADIRAASGASTGSIYHHFGDKDGIVAALYVETLRGYQAGYLAAARRFTSGEAYVKGTVRHFLRWVAANPDAARFLMDARRAPEVSPADGAIRDDTRAMMNTVAARARALMAAGEIRRVPMRLVTAFTVGAAQTLARTWLDLPAADFAASERARAREIRAMADTAWRALRP